AAGDEARLLVLAPGEEEWRFLDAARDAGVDAVAHPIGAHADPRPVATIAEELRRWRPDVVHTHLFHADLWGQLAATPLRVPGVRSLHNAHASYAAEPARSAGRLVGRLARRTIAISEHVAAFARERRLAPADRVRVIPYGIDLARWEPDDEARAGERARLGIAPSEVVVGMASRLIDGKGHPLAIEALAGLDRRDIRLLIAGDGPLRADLEVEAKRAPDASVRFLGHVEDVRVFLAACDVLLFPTLPSLSEGFGLAALEAMAAAKPVVATRVGALPEVVVDHVTGLVVEPAAGAIASALESLAADPGLRAAMGRAGRDRAEQEFGLERMVSHTRRVYAEARGR
ncbi:MAG TPA: glycosyltransferase, partial [Actinomycetota bacterium]